MRIQKPVLVSLQKLISLTLFCVISFSAVQGQQSYNINDVNGGELNVGSEGLFLYDSGGPIENYGNNEEFSVTICYGVEFAGCPRGRIYGLIDYLDVAGGNSNCNSDYLEINGANPNLPQKLCNENLTVSPLSPYVTYSDDGCILVTFKSNGNTVGGGFQMFFKREEPYSIRDETLTCGDLYQGYIELLQGSPGCFGCIQNYSPPCALVEYKGGEEVWPIDPSVTGTVTITVIGNVDFFVWARTSIGVNFCSDPVLVECGSFGTQSVTINIDPGGFLVGYNVIVDAQFDASYTISLTCGSNPCELAPDLECDIIYEQTFFDAPSQISSYDCSPDFYNFNERIYAFTPVESKEYTIRARNINGFQHPDLFILDCCTYSESGGEVPYYIIGENCSLCEKSFTNADYSEITVFLQGGQTYYIFAEQKQNAPDDFILWIDCNDNNVCEETIPITCSQTYFGDFSIYQNKVTRYSCGNSFLRFEDSEIIYTFTPTVSQVYTFNSLGFFGQSPAIFISDCCDVGNNSEPELSCSFLDCSFKSDAGITRNSAFLTAGVTYYIFVELASQNASNRFYFWVDCDCNLFTPLVNQAGNDVTFENNSQGTYVSHTIKFPFDENGANYTYTDSLSMVNGDGTITCHFPFPGCYEVCFYYRVGNQIRKCCFKYCPIIKRYDCGFPIINEVSNTSTTGTINVICNDDFTPVKNAQQFGDICVIKVRPTDGTNTTEYPCGTDITLPYGEYEVCCWNFDLACNAWEICCKIICVPYIPPSKLECGLENILVEKQSQTEYKYTWLDNPDGLEWSIMPSVNFNTSGNMMSVRYPGSGVYKVCGIGLTNMGSVIIRDTCCVYTCIDNEPDIPCEDSFRVIPLPENRVKLVCTTGRPVLRWEVSTLPPGGDIWANFIFYGESPIISLNPGWTTTITKVFAGCCGVEERCSKRFCYIDPFDCNYIMPRYLGGLNNLSLEYGFSIPEHLVGVEWRVDEFDLLIGANTNVVSYMFPAPGCYTISVLVYDPINFCYVICCKRICVDYPYDCSLLKHWFTGDEGNPNVYTVELGSDCSNPMRQMSDIKWSFNGIHYAEFDGFSTLHDIDLSLYGSPGTDIFICAMYYDPCLKACRWCYLKIRLEPPFNCNEFTPIFIAENQYTFSANGNYETTYWMIGGIDGVCFGEGLNTFDLNDPAIQNYISIVQPEYLYVYFYYRVGFCWKVCCKRICLKGPNGCEEFGDECDYFRPIYNEDFENGPPLGFGYELGDSININTEWWRGHGGVVGFDPTINSQNTGHVGGNKILQLYFDNAQTANVQVFKVTYDVHLTWSRDLMTGNYGTGGLDGDIFICSNTQCYQPSINDLIFDTNLFRFCNSGGGDIAFCSHKVEILIDRSGPVEMFVDGRKVSSPNGFEDKGAIISFLSIGGDENGGVKIDNICVAECMTCQPPTVDPGDFFPCDNIVLIGFGSGGNNTISGQFTYNGTTTGEGWVVKEVLGAALTTVYEDFSGSTALMFPGFLPGRTYIVCFKYLDENGCIQYCCYKVNIPSSCRYFTPYFAGDENPENLTFEFVLDNPNPDGLQVVAWYVGDTKVADNVNSISYRFPGQGTYYVYCVFWDPLTRCYIWCCRQICVEYPLNCDRIIIDYDGANNEYILSAEGIQQIISWNIDIPTGIPNRGYIGMDNPQRFNPADFGILPGQEIIISVRYIDADGCLKICCRRICIPVTTPIEECNNIFPIYTGNGLQYTFEVNPSADFEDISWRLHIPGTDQTIDIGSGSLSEVVDFEALVLQYPSLTLDKVCISIFYRDRVTGCYKVCCKCFCIAQNPFDCTSIKYYYSGTPSNKLIYNFILDVPGAQYISWTLDNTNSFLSDQSSFEVNFETFGISVGSDIFVTVRYYDPISECFRICCKRLCLGDPYAGCNKITSSLPVNNIITLSTAVTNPIWTIEGLTGIYSESQNPNIDLSDPQILPLVQGNSTINVCVVYMENGCCRVCCTPVCILPATVDCNNFTIAANTAVDNFTFGFTDTNSGAINTEITLPNGMIISLAGNETSYSNTLEGEYTICRNYLNGCQDTISCCQSFCLSFGLNCEPITFSINPTNDRLYTFTHNIIGGVSYLWDFGDGNTSSSDLTTVMHTYSNENRQYTVCLTVIDECNTFCQQCRDIAVGEINFSPMVVNPSCRNTNDGSIDLNITGGIPPVVIIWSNGSTSESISNLSVGNYSVTVTDGTGKDTTFTFSLTAPELANLEAAVTHTLCGESNGEISINVPNNVGIQSYNWSLTSITSNPIASLLTAGSYSVTVTDVNGCTAALEGIIVNGSEALAAFDFGMDETLCSDGTKTLDVGVVNASNVTIEWYKDGVVILSNSRTLEVSSVGTYVAVVSNTQNCVRRDTIVVNYFADMIEFPEDRIDIDLDEVVTVEVIGAVSAEWVTLDAQLSCTSCLVTTFTFVQNTKIIVTATDVNGCTKVDTVEFRFDTSPIEGPNFITPNGDGANDVLEFEKLDRFIHRKLIVFNRWGQILLTINDYNNDWDGTMGGKPLPDGAYYYVLRYGNNTPDQFEFKSDITIIRRQ